MTHEEIVADLTDIFRNVFDKDDIVLREDMSADDLEKWDSLHHINLIVAIESEFGIKFRTSEIETLSNVGDLLRSIEKKVR